MLVLLIDVSEQFELHFYFKHSKVRKFYNLGDKTFETDFSDVLFRSDGKGSGFHANKRP